MFDYHVHSEFSADCKVPIEESVASAIKAGITEIAITDHVEHQHTDPGFGYYRMEAYFASLDKARARFGDQIRILRGAEVDFHTDTADKVEQWISQNAREYDFIIGSVHYGDAAEIIFQEYYDGRTVEGVVVPYYDQLETAIRTGWFDTIGHLDIPKRYLPRRLWSDYEVGLYRDRVRSVLKAVIETDVCFEINTSGLRQAPKTSMPGPVIVRWYTELGGSLITTGTDSHAAQTIGTGVAKTLDMLQICGIREVASFDRRQRRLVPISDLAKPAGTVA